MGSFLLFFILTSQTAWLEEVILKNPKLVALESQFRADCRSPLPSSSAPSGAASIATQALADPESPALKLLNSFCYDAGKAIGYRWRADYDAGLYGWDAAAAVVEKRAFFSASFDRMWELVQLFQQMETEGVVLARGKSKRKSIKAFVRDKVQMVFCTTVNTTASGNASF